MKSGFFAFFALFFLAAILTAQEPVSSPLHPRVITGTRQVTLFGGLEKQMLQAVQKKDSAALTELLTDDFSIRSANTEPQPGDDWLASVLGKDFTLKSFTVRQVDVADLGDFAVVSYVRTQEATFKTQDQNGEFYVIDIWKKNGDSWKLSDRYVSRTSSTASAQKEDVKPTGKK